MIILLPGSRYSKDNLKNKLNNQNKIWFIKHSIKVNNILLIYKITNCCV